MNARMASRRLWCVMALAGLAGCTTIPVTGRQAFNLVPDSQADSLGAEAYQQVRSQSRLITSGSEYEQVVRVGKRIAAAANQKGFKWDFILIDSSRVVNAFCLPGGKIAVYRGILPVARDDAGLAVVLGHETAHAIARHGSERMTDQLALQLGGAGLQALLSKKSPAAQQVAMAAFGAGAAIGVILPFSRAQESEADHIGLVLMARAGYDPHSAVSFWERMMALAQGAAPPEFLSDHPSEENRVAHLEKWMPQAEKEYRPR